ncbi:hypothetical protein ACJX0J_020446, partial [Zea mays]
FFVDIFASCITPHINIMNNACIIHEIFMGQGLRPKFVGHEEIGDIQHLILLSLDYHSSRAHDLDGQGNDGTNDGRISATRNATLYMSLVVSYLHYVKHLLASKLFGKHLKHVLT